MGDAGNSKWTWRPIEPGDVGQWAVMLAAVAAADGEPDHYGEQDLFELFDLPDFDFASGSIAAYDGNVMVACASLMTRSTADPVHELRFDAAVHPAYRRRGLGGQVLDWVEQAAVPLHEKRYPGRPLTLHGRSNRGTTSENALLAARGYRPVRWWHTMRMDLAAAPPVSAGPDGVDVVGFTPDMLEDARQVRNEAFQDHWGSTETTVETWAHYLSEESFRPGFSYVAYGGGQAIGVLLSYEHDAHTKVTGIRDLYIGIVGTRRAGRNRGIASAMLSRALAAGQAAGFGTSSLFVDGDSLTGALALYERIGYVVEHTSITQAKVLITS
jgi:mycothiol synthase